MLDELVVDSRVNAVLNVSGIHSHFRVSYSRSRTMRAGQGRRQQRSEGKQAANRSPCYSRTATFE
jgi:hypothetical protein